MGNEMALSFECLRTQKDDNFNKDDCSTVCKKIVGSGVSVIYSHTLFFTSQLIMSHYNFHQSGTTKQFFRAINVIILCKNHTFSCNIFEAFCPGKLKKYSSRQCGIYSALHMRIRYNERTVSIVQGGNDGQRSYKNDRDCVGM